MATFEEPPPCILVVDEVPKFDLPSYIANYRGRTVVRRLQLVAACSTVFREEAARLAVIEAKKSKDLNIYREAIDFLKEISANAAQHLNEPAWQAQQEKMNAAETHRLENELKGYKNNLIKESIRMGNEDLGTHYYNIGDLGNAVKAYSRMRDYCTTPAHIASTAFRIIAVAVEQRNWMAVQSQVAKIRNLQMKPDDTQRTQPKVTAATGLQQMSVQDYKEAAISFINTDPSLGDSYNDLLSSNDVAVYGGLCALASMSRADLQSRVLDSPGFRNFLELEPHIRRAITFYCASKYSQCLEILESYRADYMLDIYLQPHVAEIYRRIRTKSIVQYFQPFSKVTLESMEKTFGTSLATRFMKTTTNNSINPPTFQEELIDLIDDGRLDARIDLENGVLVAREKNVRAEMQNEACEVIEKFINEARLKLVRLNVINAGLEVKAQPKKKTAWDGEGNNAWVDDTLAGYAGQNYPSAAMRGGGAGAGEHVQQGGYSVRNGR